MLGRKKILKYIKSKRVIIHRRKDLSTFIALVIIATTLIVGNFATLSYGKKVQFETPFESSTIPACGDEEVIITGIANFAFEEKTDKTAICAQPQK